MKKQTALQFTSGQTNGKAQKIISLNLRGGGGGGRGGNNETIIYANKMCLWNTNAPETAIFWEM